MKKNNSSKTFAKWRAEIEKPFIFAVEFFTKKSGATYLEALTETHELPEIDFGTFIEDNETIAVKAVKEYLLLFSIILKDKHPNCYERKLLRRSLSNMKTDNILIKIRNFASEHMADDDRKSTNGRPDFILFKDTSYEINYELKNCVVQCPALDEFEEGFKDLISKIRLSLSREKLDECDENIRQYLEKRRLVA